MKTSIDKAIGLILSILSITVFVFGIYYLIYRFSFTLFIIILPILIVMSGFLKIGSKLILHEKEQLIQLDAIRQRANKYMSKKRKIASPMLIYICGIDGSGKTTQIQYIAHLLKERGIEYKHVWLRWAAFTSYPFLAICRILGYSKWKIKGSIRYPEHYFYRNKTLSRVWTCLFTIDMLIYSYYRVKIPIMRNYMVLCDRFIFDAIVDLICETKNVRLLKSPIFKLFLTFFPRQYIAILLDLKEENAYMRKKDIPSIEYLRERRRGYLDLAYALKIPILDANRSPREIHSMITNQFLIHFPFWYRNLNNENLA